MFLASLLAFLETPAGVAAVAAIPGLVGKLFAIGAQKGLITPEDIAEYLASQKAFDTLVPKRTAAPAPTA